MPSSHGLLRRIIRKGVGSESLFTAGQPTHATHPELLRQSELTPGINACEYAARRDALLSLMPSACLAIFSAAAGSFMTGHIPYPYRQDADFMYLTGIAQPQAIAILGGAESRAPGFTLFVPKADDQEARWTGARLDTDAAVHVFGADEALPVSQEGWAVLFNSICGISAPESHFIQRNGGVLHMAVPALRTAMEQQRVAPLRSLVHSLRWRKSASELRLMRKSAQTAAEGIRSCMELSQPGVSEHCLAARFEYECKMRGAQRMAYPSVVAGGDSATIIHYGSNDKVVRDGELLLVDAGCERYGYASDVTRTWPVSGKFSPEQRAVYDIVLDIHKECLRQCRLGTTLRDVHQLSIKLASEGIADLRLLPGQLASSISREAYREFYPHSLGKSSSMPAWLGLIWALNDARWKAA